MGKEFIIWPSAMCVDGDFLWIYHGALNALFKYNLKEKYCAKYICSFNDEKLIREYAVASLINTGNEIYSIPLWGKYIHVYNYSNQTENIIHVPNEEFFFDKMIFSRGYLFMGKIYCIPEEYDYILSIDIQKKEVNVEFDLKSFFLDMGVSDYLIDDSCFNKDGYIYAVIADTNKLIIYDLISKIADVISIEEEKKVYMVDYSEGCLYISVQNNNVMYRYDISKNCIVDEYVTPIENFKIKVFDSEKVFLDSITDKRYALYSNDKWEDYYSEQNVEEIYYPYTYSDGIICTIKDRFLYFDRASYKLKYIYSNGKIDDKGKYINGCLEPSIFGHSEYDLLTENNMFSIEFLMKYLI